MARLSNISVGAKEKQVALKNHEVKLGVVDELLYSSRIVEAVWEQMTQIDDKFKMLMEVHKEQNSLLPLEMQEQNEEWLDDVD